jgi:hypothetical protein
MRPFRTQKAIGAALVVCTVWPIIIGLLWVATARTVPLIKVRWVPGVADGTRSTAERDLSLVWRAPNEPRTVTYLLMDSTAENIRRIVHHPLVEDTAFIDRAAYALTNAPSERIWAGDRVTTPWPWALFYASVLGIAVCVITLLYRARDRIRYVAPGPVLLCVLWLAAFLFTVSSFVFYNDSFDRISRARQIARYGEWPFRDFLDPGYFMTEFVSAGLQLLLGDSLLGDVLLSSVCIATGTVLVAALSLQASRSLIAALAVSLLALLALPRGYDFDKVLFYPFVLALCWRYVDVPGAKRVWMLAAGVVVAALFRYDTAIYAVAAAVVAFIVVHAGDWRMLWRRLGLLAAAVTCLSLPALAFLQLTAGVPAVVDQVVTYAVREGTGTRIVTLPAISLDSGVWTFENANAFLYYLFHALPLAGVFILLVKGWSHSTSRNEIAKVASLSVLCLILNFFILRHPIAARAGGMIGPAAILASWMFRSVWQVRGPAARLLLRTGSVVVLGLFVWSLSTAAVWEERLPQDVASPSRFIGLLKTVAASPPDADLIRSRALTALSLYVRECTRPDDRILVTLFAPEIAFFAQRGFAGGLAALHGVHWSEPRFQQRSLQHLIGYPPALIIQRPGGTEFREIYPILARYVSEHYRSVGTTESLVGPGPESLLLLVRNDRSASGRHSASALPCFR